MIVSAAAEQDVHRRRSDLASQAILGAWMRSTTRRRIIDNFPACTPAVVTLKFAAVTVKGPKRNTCLSAAQITAIQKLAGAKCQGRAAVCRLGLIAVLAGDQRCL
jgi:hypothetical protein